MGVLLTLEKHINSLIGVRLKNVWTFLRVWLVEWPHKVLTTLLDTYARNSWRTGFRSELLYTYISILISVGISDHSLAYLTGVTGSCGSRSICMWSIRRQNAARRSHDNSLSAIHLHKPRITHNYVNVNCCTLHTRHFSHVFHTPNLSYSALLIFHTTYSSFSTLRIARFPGALSSRYSNYKTS